MNTTMISVKITPELKKAAQDKAERMNLSLSAVIKNNLLRFVNEREVVFVDDYDGAVYDKDQVSDILQARKNVNCKNLSPKFDNAKDAISYLHSVRKTKV